MNNNDKKDAVKKNRMKLKLPESGVVQPSYGRYGGFYAIITGLENRFFAKKKDAGDWMKSLGVEPIYC